MMDDGWENSFHNFLRRYLNSVPGRLEEAAKMLGRLDATLQDQDALWRLERVFHGFSGTGGTYGFPEVSDVAAKAEYLVGFLRVQDCAPSDEQVEQLRAYVAEITAQFGGPSRLSAEPPLATIPPRPSVLVVQEDEHCAEVLVNLLRGERYEVHLARSAAEARDKLELLKAAPDALLADLWLPDGTCYELVSWFRQFAGGEKSVVFVLSDQTRFLDKVEAISSGADAFLEKPVDLQGLVSRLAYALHRAESPPRVLSFEDDPEQAAYIRMVLESGGYEVRICPDSACFEADLAEFKPDLLLMDILLPIASGIDLVKYVRQSATHMTLPAIFLTSLAGIQDRISALDAGGDDFLVKPVAAAHLLAAVAARLKQARAQRALMDRDGLTRMLTRAALLERAEGTFSKRPRENSTTAFVMIDLDHFKQVNDTYGHPVGDRVLASLAAFLRLRLRQSDVVGRYGGEEFALILEDLGSTDVEKLMDSLRQNFSEVPHQDPNGRPFHCAFSAGVSLRRPEIGSLADWIAEADAALYEAKAGGRNCVRVRGA